MSKKKMLYIMGIDWFWIYQRPQLFADKLAQDYDVTVVYGRSILSKERRKPSASDKKFRTLWTLPYQEKNGIIGGISRLWNHKVFRDIRSFDCIYVSYPLYARYIPEDYSGIIIYDCIDNFDALYPDTKRVHRIIKQENALIKRCDLLFVSAEKLGEKVDRIAGSAKSTLIRNAANIGFISDIRAAQLKENYQLCYIGTISKWFDYELIGRSLEENTLINYQLVGPAEGKFEHERVRYHGKVNHDELATVVQDYDCFIMPFVVNDIVEYVDPVKFYEYIALGKCIISVYYQEIERFRDFVYFYENEEEYIKLLKELCSKGFPAKYTKQQQIEFLENNTWETRYDTMKKEILKIGI